MSLWRPGGPRREGPRRRSPWGGGGCDVGGDDAVGVAAVRAAGGETLDEIGWNGCNRGAVDVRAKLGVARGVAVRAVAVRGIFGGALEKGPTQKSASKGPAGVLFTRATLLYRSSRRPRTSPTRRILRAFGSDMATRARGVRRDRAPAPRRSSLEHPPSIGARRAEVSDIRAPPRLRRERRPRERRGPSGGCRRAPRRSLRATRTVSDDPRRGV